MTVDQQWTPAGAIIGSAPLDCTTLPLAELIDACASGMNAAWKEFIRRYNPIIARTAARIAWDWDEYSPQVVDDLVQATYLKLCAREARVLRKVRFKHVSAIFGFLKVVTANVATDYFRGLNTKVRGGGLTVALNEGLEVGVCAAGAAALEPPEVTYLIEEVDAVLRTKLPPKTRERDRTIFWLHHRDGLTVKQIAVLPLGLKVEGVEVRYTACFGSCVRV